ncbi:UHRF1-binding protein 1-like isoform X2 [Cimex lectularius]|uniref:UHRF1-binding protein 1-like n=1 Tax=Cimex lectularius TaxID=79782 RepID=A0A8I6SVA4_CIMLE|nr:UHRF1-binding protein 1-like isoform X2 [Cimex lectularius]
MVSLLKNQIFKHLSRYTKNLSPDKINLSTFKGEGELTCLELDEIVLTDLLELPSWVRLTSACCNKVEFRIQWTRLKYEPIRFALDEVRVEIETCEELRSLSAQQGLSAYAGTEYSFANKVVDGMTISVNEVKVTFKTPAFNAAVQLQIMRILVESKSPDWKKVELTKTRKKDKSKKHILIFKTIEWQTLRLEANSTKEKGLDSLRLFTNMAKCRLTIKKRTSDCFVMGCKLLLILEEFVWVLTDSQLKAVLHFVESLSGLVQKANEITRIKKAARKLELLPEYHAQVAQQERSGDTTEKEQSFALCDVVETSYHLWAQKIDLHLVDDPGAGRSIYPLLKNGHTLRLLINNLQVDYYPYHLAAADRAHWARYNQASSPHAEWLSAAQSQFKNSLLQLIDQRGRNPSFRGSNSNDEDEDRKSSESSPSQNNVKKYVIANLAKVMTSCIVLRVQDFTVYAILPNNKHLQKEFIKGDKERNMPSDVTVHAEFTYYYYPGNIAFPLPVPKFYVQINPVIMNFDVNTILWLNSFALNLHQSLQEIKQNSTNNLNYVDVKIEAIMPRVIFESNVEIQCGQRDRPKALHIQVSRALISNVRSSDGCSRADLAKCVNALQLGSLFFGNEFPVKEGDFAVIPDKFIDHIQFKDNIRTPLEELPTNTVSELVSYFRKTLLWTESRDVWCINFEPIWGEFYGARGVAHNKPVAFIDSFPLKIWVYLKTESSTRKDFSKPELYALAYISNLVSVQINHYQLLFLLRLADDFAELLTILEMDSRRIMKRGSSGVVVGAVVPQLEVTLVMPSQTPGKESSGADLESVIPDTSSLADDIVTNPSIQWNAVLTTDLQDGGVYKRENTVPAMSPPSNQLSLDVTPTFLESKQLNSFMGLSSMKKGFTNFTNLLDSKLKFSPNDASDSFSTRSDGTSDSENYVLNGQVDSMFNIDTCDEPIEYGSEALEEFDDHSGATISVTTPSENPSNASSYKRKDLISVATFKLGQVEIIQQSQGLTSTIKAQVSNIAIEECPAIPWDEFQNKFNTRSRGWTEVCDKPTVKPGVRIRKEHTVQYGDLNLWPTQKISSWFNDLVTVALSDICITLNASTVSSIAEFFEDDIESPSIPIKISMENMDLNIIEEKNSMAAGGTPINVSISRLHISRDKDKVILIEPTIAEKPSTYTQEIYDLKNENEQLRRRLAAMERLNEENHRLRKCEEESHELRSFLHSAQDHLQAVLEENERLSEMLRNFQRGDKQQSSGKR